MWSRHIKPKKPFNTSLSDCILPTEMNFKCIYELTALAQTVPFRLKLSLSEALPGIRTNYSEPSVDPEDKIIVWVSPLWPWGFSSWTTLGNTVCNVHTLNVTSSAEFGVPVSFISINVVFILHFAKKKCLIKEPEISVKQILMVLHRSGRGRVAIIKNTAYLRENFPL